MNLLDLLKFVVLHPEHTRTVAKLAEVFRSDPTLMQDITHMIQTIAKLQAVVEADPTLVEDITKLIQSTSK